ncbi:MAG TPA: outer membrane beta-barrel protein [Flavobacterium sp.]|nr:outer membrane beta-barrel protein [Flavobacterium sp.]
MKKLLFSIFAIAGICTANAQETKFGAKAGLAMITVEQTVTMGGVTVTASGSETGFFAGGFVEIGVNDTFSIQPELLYVGISDFNMINLPILGKFTFAEKFSAMAGPGITYMLDAEEDEFKVNVDIAAGYEITESLDVTARYSLGFGDVKVGGFYAGVGYKF